MPNPHSTDAGPCGPNGGNDRVSPLSFSGTLEAQRHRHELTTRKFAEARSQGYRSFGLDVSFGNPRDEALYRRLGLEVKKKKTFSDRRANVPNARKMELVL